MLAAVACCGALLLVASSASAATKTLYASPSGTGESCSSAIPCAIE